MKSRLFFLLIPLAHQNIPERCSEGFVAEGVADGVDGAVNITQPVAECPQSLWNTVLTESIDQHHDVIR